MKLFVLGSFVLVACVRLASANSAPTDLMRIPEAQIQEFKRITGRDGLDFALEITLDAPTGQSRLVVPRWRVAGFFPPAGEQQLVPRGPGMVPTVVSGLALALATLLAGLWLARRQPRLSAAAAAGFGVVAGLVLAAGWVTASASPAALAATHDVVGPTSARARVELRDLEVSDSFTGVELHLTREQWGELVRQLGPGASPDVARSEATATPRSSGHE